MRSAPRDESIWVWAIAEPFVGQSLMYWQGLAFWSPEANVWLTNSHNDRGESLIVLPFGWRTILDKDLALPKRQEIRMGKLLLSKIKRYRQESQLLDENRKKLPIQKGQ